jgi:hypothetical protein
MKIDGTTVGQMADTYLHRIMGNTTETIINNLPAYSTVGLRIAALNGQYQGDYSQQIRIQTPEGLPG